MNSYIILDSDRFSIQIDNILSIQDNYAKLITRYHNDVLKLHLSGQDYIKIKGDKVVYFSGGSITHIPYPVDIILIDPPIEDIYPIESMITHDVYTYIMLFLEPTANEHLIMSSCISDPVDLLINHIEEMEEASFDPVMALSYMDKESISAWEICVKKAFIKFLYSSPRSVEHMINMVRVDEKMSCMPLKDRVFSQYPPDE